MRSIFAVLALVLTGALFHASSLAAAEGKSAKKPNGTDLFSSVSVVRLKIEIPPPGLEALRKDPKEYVKATVRSGDVVLTNVGVRMKGQAASQSIDKKPSLTLKFNEFVKGQELHGRTKVLLNNSLTDPSAISPILAGEIFRAADVPAPKATFARVELNGRDAGLYSLTEAANKDFLATYFKKTKGNLYEGDKTDVTDKLEKDSGDGPDDQSDVKTLAAALREADPEQRWKRLTPVVDLNRFITFLAVEVLVGHKDGYGMGQNNYRLYHDPATSQFTFIPHGLDELFEKPETSLHPDWKGLGAKAVLGIPEGRKRYEAALAKVAGDQFKVEALTKRIDELAAVARAELDPAAVKAFDAGVAALRKNVAKRASYVTGQTKAPASGS